MERKNNNQRQVRYKNKEKQTETTMEVYWDTLYVRICKERHFYTQEMDSNLKYSIYLQKINNKPDYQPYATNGF